MKNPQKILIFFTLLILGIVIFLGYLFDKKETERSNLHSNFETQVHSIYLNQDGFVPDKILIHAGDTVKFTSTKSGWFWPASNPHPTHTTYVAFDPGEPVSSEKSWSFTFKETGEWHYHDHLAPYFTGTVMVSDKEKTVSTTP